MKILESIEHKIFEPRFPWDTIDRSLAHRTPEVLSALREACLVESYFSAYMGKMLELFWYDLDATTIFTIEAFEAYTHYYCLRRYLEKVDYNPVRDEEIIALREKDHSESFRDEIRELVNFGMTEFFAAHFFTDLAAVCQEPVLRSMLERFAKEEEVHAEFAFGLLSKRTDRDGSLRERILHQIQHFTHVGAYVLPSVSSAKYDNVRTLQLFNRRIEQLFDIRPSDYAAEIHKELP